MGEVEQVKEAEKRFKSIFKPIEAKIVGIQVGEFFPAKTIASEEFEIT